MNKAITRTRTTTRANENTGLEIETGKIGIATMGAAAGLISLWAAACFVGGLVSSGGPVALAQAWLGAVIGG